jgi:hypothetical protein
MILLQSYKKARASQDMSRYTEEERKESLKNILISFFFKKPFFQNFLGPLFPDSRVKECELELESGCGGIGL